MDSDVTGKFYQSPETSMFWFEPDACLLRRLTHKQALACLHDTPIVMLGDSVTRYQFTALAHWLVTGLYHHPFDLAPESVTNVDHHGHDYKRMFKELSEHISGHAPSHAVLQCVCDHSLHEERWHFAWRGDEADAPQKVDLYFGYSGLISNRTLFNLEWAMTGQTPRAAFDLPATPADPGTTSSTTASGGKDSSSGHVAEANAAGAAARRVLRGVAGAQDSRCGGSGADGGASAPAGCGSGPTLVAPPTRLAIDHPTPKLLLVNGCGHYNGEVNNITKLMSDLDKFWPQAKRMAAETAGAAGGVGGGGATPAQIAFKACLTPHSEWVAASKRLRRAAAGHGLPTMALDAVVAAAIKQRMLTTWYSGTIHFLPFMYEQINDLMLNILCPVTMHDEDCADDSDAGGAGSEGSVGDGD